MSRRTETQAVETATAPDDVLSCLRDPRRIPEWAPDFADRVEGSPDTGWRVFKGAGRFSLRLRVGDAGTVDYLREVAPGQEGGAFLRVTPRPRGGSVIVMTLPVPPDMEHADVAATLKRELQALVKLLEVS